MAGAAVERVLGHVDAGPVVETDAPAALDPARLADDGPARAGGHALGQRLGRRRRVRRPRCRPMPGAHACVNARERQSLAVDSLTTNAHGCGSTTAAGRRAAASSAQRRPWSRSDWRIVVSGGSARAASRRVVPADDRQVARAPRARARGAACSAPIASSSLMHSRPVGGSGPSSSAPAAASPCARSLICTSRPTLTPKPSSRPRVTRCAGALGAQRPVARGRRARTAGSAPPVAYGRAPAGGRRRPRPPRARRSPRADGPRSRGPLWTTTGSPRRSTASTSGCPSGSA